MKTKEYRKKYLPWDETRRGELLQELTLDLVSTWENVYEIQGKKISLARCESLTRESQDKFTVLAADFPVLTPQVWKNIYSHGLAPLKRTWCAQELKEKEAAAKRRQEWEENIHREASAFREAFAYAALFSLLGLDRRPVDHEALTYLGLDAKAKAEDINQAYRKKALVTHPDQGGSQEAFLKLTEMKNRALATV